MIVTPKVETCQNDEEVNVKVAVGNLDNCPSCQTLRSYLRKRVRVFISDGRVLSGKLQCFDSFMNIIMIETEEILFFNEKDKEIRRRVGRTIIPGKHIVKLESDFQLL
ncbi:hypothetical protein WA158_001174 [Blastocystis sp. Blastoise]